MNQAGIGSILSPRSIAVVGASNKPGSVGAAVFANVNTAGFQGSIFAVNHKREPVQGSRAYGSLAELPETPDLVVVCTPAPTVPNMVRESGALGIGGMIVISAGFREVGSRGRELESDLKAAAHEYPSLRIVGPNCLGVLRPSVGLNASFSPVMPRSGRLTFLSQSGALCTAILDWSMTQDFGFAACVSVGNTADVSMGDLIEYFADDDQTDAILLYIEGLDNPQRFLSAAQACSRRKPILAYKSGRFAASSQAAASHTGAIATADAVYEAAFRHAGVERVASIQQLFDSGKLLIGQRHTRGDRLAIVTNAGGPGVVASDEWLSQNRPLAQLSPETISTLNQALPACWSHGNPIDVLGDASVDRFDIAIQQALRDPKVDALLTIVTPQLMTDAERIGRAVVDAARQGDKPIVVCMMGGKSVEAGRLALRSGGIPTYDFPEEALDALGHLIATSQKRAGPISPTRKEFSRRECAISPTRRDYWLSEFSNASGLLSEARSKELLADFGIPVVKTAVAHSVREADTLARQCGYPVALKIVSPDISHKTDVGGVLLNIANADDLQRGYATIMDAVTRRWPQARLQGVAVQPMIRTSAGVELLLGMRRDPQFGPILLVGAGGVTAELQKDSTIELPPFDEDCMDRLLRSLRLFPLLTGFRARPAIDLSRLRDVMVRFAQIAQELPAVATIEINPLLVAADSILALDARIILENPAV